MATQTKAKPAAWPSPVVVEPQTTHTHTFILLHGLGSNGRRFGRELLDTGISSNKKSLADAFPGARFIFPTAKTRRVTALKRSRVTAWFDMYSLPDRSLREDVQIEGLIESSEYIRFLISQEADIVSTKNIVLGGLSNGCAMGLITFLSLEYPLGAYIGMSARLPFRPDINEIIRSTNDATDTVMFGEEDVEKKSSSAETLDFIRDLLSIDALDAEAEASEKLLSTPVFFGHGVKDEVVPCHLGEEAARTLQSLGVDVTLKRYPDLGHWYQVPEEIDDIMEFLSKKL
jgi:predicted esterase